MTPTTRNTGIAVAGAAALAFGAYALGSQAGDGSASARDSSAQRSQTAAFVHRDGRFGARERRGPGEFGLVALAGKLGVTPSALRDALASVRDELAPKQDPRDQFAAKLADALSLPTAKVA